MFLRARRAQTSTDPSKEPGAAPRPARASASNQAMQRLLRVSQPGDSCEQEADRVADAVMRSAEPGALPAIAPAGPTPAPQSGGRPLPGSARRFFESRFGRDFGDVRVHTGSAADASARSIQALAYTRGRDIVFRGDQYAPESAAGRRLLAHELTHVLQQRAAPSSVVQRKPGDPSKDRETLLGETLREPSFAAGVSVAFYDENYDEARRRAEDWAKRERAFGIRGKKITAANLVVGRAIPDSFEIGETLTQMGKVLSRSLAKVPAPPEYPSETAKAPAKIRHLAVFSHGTTSWCGLGGGIRTSNAAEVAKQIAPTLASNVRVVLYSCSGGRGFEEKKDWVKNTMKDGGSDSLAATLRDALIDENVDSASVWGHSTVGHPTRNIGLREFTAEAGKGTAGRSFASTYVFDEATKESALGDVEALINSQGYLVDRTDSKFRAVALWVISKSMYKGYEDASKTLTGPHIAEEAPLYPWQTAHRIREHWNETYWPANKGAAARDVIKRLKLKK